MLEAHIQTLGSLEDSLAEYIEIILRQLNPKFDGEESQVITLNRIAEAAKEAITTRCFTYAKFFEAAILDRDSEVCRMLLKDPTTISVHGVKMQQNFK